jgi:hypothetical protein
MKRIECYTFVAVTLFIWLIAIVARADECDDMVTTIAKKSAVLWKFV